MKPWLILGLLFLSSQSYSQGEFSSTFVDDRFELYNGRINQMFWEVGPFLLANGNQFDLSNGERRRLKKLRYHWVEELYLFKSEVFWTSETVEKCYDPYQGEKGIITGPEQFVVFLSRNMMKYNLVLYRDQDLKSFYFVDELPNLEKFELENVQCKRTWYYQKNKNKLKQELKCVGFFGRIEGVDVSFWLYFPKVKNIETLGEATLEWFDQLRTFTNDKEQISIERSENGFHDLDAVIMERYVKSKVDRIREFSDIKGLKGVRLQLNKKDSLVNDSDEAEFSFFENGKLIAKGAYIDNAANGLFEFYKDDVLVISQEFKKGLREGEGNVYHNGGMLLHRNHYNDGFLNGKQLLYNTSSFDSVEYVFENKMLQGKVKGFGDNIYMEGKTSRGLVLDNWTYRVRVPKYIRTIINRAPDYFQDKFLVNEPWFAKSMLTGNVNCTFNVSYKKGEDCLNKKCINLTFLSND